MGEVIELLCVAVHDGGGSVMSYTGDGIIGLFEETEGVQPAEVALNAVRAVKAARNGVRDWWQRRSPEPTKHDLSLRAALHWGAVFVPAGGRLGGEAIGADVVFATRVCDLARSVEQGAPADADTTCLASAAFVEKTRMIETPLVALRQAALKDFGFVDLYRVDLGGSWPPELRTAT